MKIIALAGGILAAGALVLGPAGIALADDGTAPAPTDTTTSAPATAAPAPDPTASTAPVAAATTDPAPAPAPAPDPTAPTSTVVAATLTLSTASVVVTPPADPYVAVLWATDTAGVKYGQHIVQIVHESTETLIAIPTTCGTSWQSDVYLESAGLEALLDNGNGKLAGPDGAQDGSFLAPGGQGVAYNYVDNDACPPPPPAGVTCTLTGTSYTEDVDWTSTLAGESLTGQTAAVDHYYGATGNLQGLTTDSITETTQSASGQSALAVIEVNPHGPAYTGGPTISYETLSPVGPNADGTTDELAGTWYTSKIPYANAGGQGNPEPMSWFIAQQPNNSLISFGVHYQTHGDGTSVVSALHTDCLTENYVAPTVTFPEGSSTGPTCSSDEGANGGTFTLPVLPATEKYALTTTDSVFGPAGSRPLAGTYSLTDGETEGPFTAHTLASAFVQQGSTTYGPYTGEAEIAPQNTNSDAPCYTVFTGAVAAVSVSTPKCGALGVATDSETDATLDAPLDQTAGTHTASFTAEPGFEFGTGDSATTTETVSYTISDIVACPTVTTPKLLGFTGDNTNYGAGLGLGLGLGLLGGLFVALKIRKTRKAHAEQV